MAGKDLLSKLADAGEEAIHRLAKVPGGEQFAHALTSMRERTDELQKRVRGIDELEARIEELERRVEALGGTATRAKRRPASSRTSTKSASRSSSAKKTTAAKPRTRRSSSAPTGDESPS
jgi:phage shock protein A